MRPLNKHNNSKYAGLVSYRIAQNFDVFDAFQPDRQNLPVKLLKTIQRLQVYGERH